MTIDYEIGSDESASSDASEPADDPISLSRQADELLKAAGLDIFGRDKTSESYRQSTFERRMRTGAYSRSSEKRKA
jgi:hypothetical protein